MLESAGSWLDGRLTGMIRRDGEQTPEEGVEAVPEENTDPIQIERDAPRPTTILRVAGELEERGGTILELFKEIESPLGNVVLPIYMRQGERDFFVEVATGPWNDRTSGEALDKAVILRNSEHARAGLQILSGYPVPPEVEFYFGTSPDALRVRHLARNDAVSLTHVRGEGLVVTLVPSWHRCSRVFVPTHPIYAHAGRYPTTDVGFWQS
jgi:hypothetical protein